MLTDLTTASRAELNEALANLQMTRRKHELAASRLMDPVLKADALADAAAAAELVDDVLDEINSRACP